MIPLGARVNFAKIPHRFSSSHRISCPFLPRHLGSFLDRSDSYAPLYADFYSSTILSLSQSRAFLRRRGWKFSRLDSFTLIVTFSPHDHHADTFFLISYNMYIYAARTFTSTIVPPLLPLLIPRLLSHSYVREFWCKSPSGAYSVCIGTHWATIIALNSIVSS